MYITWKWTPSERWQVYFSKYQSINHFRVKLTNIENIVSMWHWMIWNPVTSPVIMIKYYCENMCYFVCLRRLVNCCMITVTVISKHGKSRVLTLDSEKIVIWILIFVIIIIVNKLISGNFPLSNRYQTDICFPVEFWREITLS